MTRILCFHKTIKHSHSFLIFSFKVFLCYATHYWACLAIFIHKLFYLCSTPICFFFTHTLNTFSSFTWSFSFIYILFLAHLLSIIIFDMLLFKPSLVLFIYFSVVYVISCYSRLIIIISSAYANVYTFIFPNIPLVLF